MQETTTLFCFFFFLGKVEFPSIRTLRLGQLPFFVGDASVVQFKENGVLCDNNQKSFRRTFD